MKKLIAAIAVAFVAGACGSSSPTAPSSSPAAQTPTTTTAITLTGNVTSSAGGPLSGAVVAILDGPNAGKQTTTSGSGAYSFTGVTAGNANLSANASGFQESRGGTYITSGSTLNFTLTKNPDPIFSASGKGDNVFDMPTYVKRIRIQADYGGLTSNFIVRIGSSLVVNELVGTYWGQTHFDGTYLTSGGTVQITDSSGVAWSFNEVR